MKTSAQPTAQQSSSAPAMSFKPTASVSNEAEHEYAGSQADREIPERERESQNGAAAQTLAANGAGDGGDQPGGEANAGSAAGGAAGIGGSGNGSSDDGSGTQGLQFGLGGYSLSGPPIQAKLRVSQSDDPQEREADQVANAVASGGAIAKPGKSQAAVTPRSGAGQVLRHASGSAANAKGGGEIGGAGEARIRGLSGGGSPLPGSERSFFESKLGHDFGGVRVHQGAEARAATQSIGARAFTRGHDIAFAPGEYQPESIEGRKLLAHELTHVVQQSGPAGAARSAGPGDTNGSGSAITRKAEGDIVQREPDGGDTPDTSEGSADSQAKGGASAKDSAAPDQEVLIARLVDIMKAGGVGSPAVQKFLADLDPKIAQSVLEAASARFKESGGDQDASGDTAAANSASGANDAAASPDASGNLGAQGPNKNPLAGIDVVQKGFSFDPPGRSKGFASPKRPVAGPAISGVGAAAGSSASGKLSDKGGLADATKTGLKKTGGQKPAKAPAPAAKPAVPGKADQTDRTSLRSEGPDVGELDAAKDQAPASAAAGDAGAPAGVPPADGGAGESRADAGGRDAGAPQIGPRDAAGGDGRVGDPAAKEGEIGGQEPVRAESGGGGDSGPPSGAGGDDPAGSDAGPVIAPTVGGKAQVHLDSFATGVNRQKASIQQALGQSHAAADRKGKEQKARVRQAVQEKKQAVGADLETSAQSRARQSEQQQIELEAHAEQQKERIASRYSTERERLDAIFAARRKEIERSAAARRREVRSAEGKSVKAVQEMTKRHVREAMAYADQVEARYQNAGFGKPTTIGLMSHRLARSTASELKAFQPKAISKIEDEANQAVEKLEDNEAKQLERLEEQYDKSVEALGEVRDRANAKLDEALSGLLPRLRDAGRRILRFLTDTKALLVSGLDRLSGSYEEKTDRAVAKSKQALTKGANEQLSEMDEAAANVFEHADDFDQGDDQLVAALFAGLNADVESGGAKASEQILASPIKIGDEVTWGGDLAADAAGKLAARLNEIVNSSEGESGDGIRNIDVSSKEGISKVGTNSVEKLGAVTAAFDSSSKELARKADAAFGQQVAKAKERFTAIEKDTGNKQREALRVSKREIDKEATKIANSSVLGTVGSFVFQVGANVLNFLAGLIVGILITLVVAIIAIVVVIVVVALAKVIAAALAIGATIALIIKVVAIAVAAVVVIYGLLQAGAKIIENLRAVFTDDSLTAYERGKLLGESLAEIVLFLLPFAKGRVRLPAVLGRRLSRFLASARGGIRRNITRPLGRRFDRFVRGIRTNRIRQRQQRQRQRRDERVPQSEVKKNTVTEIRVPGAGMKITAQGQFWYCWNPCTRVGTFLRQMLRQNRNFADVRPRILQHIRRLRTIRTEYARTGARPELLRRMRLLLAGIRRTQRRIESRRPGPVSPRPDVRSVRTVTTRNGVEVEVPSPRIQHALESHTIENFHPVDRLNSLNAQGILDPEHITSFMKPGTATNPPELVTLLRQILQGRSGSGIQDGAQNTIDFAIRGDQFRVILGPRPGGTGLQVVSIFVTSARRPLRRAEIRRMALDLQSGRLTLDQIRAELLRRFAGI